MSWPEGESWWLTTRPTSRTNGREIAASMRPRHWQRCAKASGDAVFRLFRPRHTRGPHRRVRRVAALHAPARNGAAVTSALARVEVVRAVAAGGPTAVARARAALTDRPAGDRPRPVGRRGHPGAGHGPALPGRHSPGSGELPGRRPPVGDHLRPSDAAGPPRPCASLSTHRRNRPDRPKRVVGPSPAISSRGSRTPRRRTTPRGPWRSPAARAWCRHRRTRRGRCLRRSSTLRGRRGRRRRPRCRSR